ITNDLKEYEVYNVDDFNQIAYAEYNGQYIKPHITKRSKNLNLSNNSVKKSVGLYITHNDESYIPGDNVSSIYGEGGIHDVANEIKKNFEKQNYTVFLNETLHLPHDSGAYGRSYSTAKTLLEKNIDALFDIHRDGVAKSVYVKNIDGVERCKVRIVVGQANPNKDANLQFAMYLVSVAEEYCPWLFLDIYYAKGHYNQALTSKGLLFEMGTYLAEKELVLETVPYLTKVIDKTLFSTVVDENNNLTITDKPTEEQQQNIVNNVLSTGPYVSGFWSKHSNNVIIFCFVFISILSLCLYLIFKYKKRGIFYKKKN
ncbi:MAG: stage II sporulation protein P, partial [Clostridia bacterium]|nr:stage II sporulation protein P [Clostridia bacterium]